MGESDLHCLCLKLSHIFLSWLDSLFLIYSFTFGDLTDLLLTPFIVPRVCRLPIALSSSNLNNPKIQLFIFFYNNISYIKFLIYSHPKTQTPPPPKYPSKPLPTTNSHHPLGLIAHLCILSHYLHATEPPHPKSQDTSPARGRRLDVAAR